LSIAANDRSGTVLIDRNADRLGAPFNSPAAVLEQGEQGVLRPVLAENYRMGKRAVDVIEVPAADMLAVGMHHDLAKRFGFVSDSLGDPDLVQDFLRPDVQDHSFRDFADRRRTVDDSGPHAVTRQLVCQGKPDRASADDQYIRLSFWRHPALARIMSPAFGQAAPGGNDFRKSYLFA
jgi:hypothetical protein